jgi:hypothetical protein
MQASTWLAALRSGNVGALVARSGCSAATRWCSWAGELSGAHLHGSRAGPRIFLPGAVDVPGLSPHVHAPAPRVRVGVGLGVLLARDRRDVLAAQRLAPQVGLQPEAERIPRLPEEARLECTHRMLWERPAAAEGRPALLPRGPVGAVVARSSRMLEPDRREQWTPSCRDKGH